MLGGPWSRRRVLLPQPRLSKGIGPEEGLAWALPWACDGWRRATIGARCAGPEGLVISSTRHKASRWEKQSRQGIAQGQGAAARRFGLSGPRSHPSFQGALPPAPSRDFLRAAWPEARRSTAAQLCPFFRLQPGDSAGCSPSTGNPMALGVVPQAVAGVKAHGAGN